MVFPTYRDREVVVGADGPVCEDCQSQSTRREVEQMTQLRRRMIDDNDDKALRNMAKD